jgi:hypothetical protein
MSEIESEKLMLSDVSNTGLLTFFCHAIESRSRFPGSELVFENVNSTWLKPSLKWMINLKMLKELGLGSGTGYHFGLRDGHELEEWDPGIRLLEEWSYIDEDEPRIGLIRRFRNWKLLRYTQWTLRYRLE